MSLTGSFDPSCCVQRPDQVDQLGIHLARFGAPPVAHEMVELLQCVRIVAAVRLEGDGQALFGVDVEEREGALLARLPASPPANTRRRQA